MNKTFVGFGFGPIQSGLFLYEAYRSGNFSRFVVAEVDAALVDAIRANHGRYTINVARRDRIDRFNVDGLELYNPRDESDRRKLIAAVAGADELATALPSVGIYDLGDPSVADLLARGLTKRKEPLATIIYAAENHNHAAEILHDHLVKRVGEEPLAQVQVLNTVIGKMSGVISDPEEIDRLSLIPLAPGFNRAVLVEEFNRILISRIRLPGYGRGIDVFIEKPDLLPFEEAKLYGHNAIHALIAYLADAKGLATIAEAGHDPQIMEIGRRAFLDESGAALICKYRDLGDDLFTPEGYEAYARDLLARMVNPNLNDLVARVGRDHVRKLGYDDRIYGTMRLALRYGIEPRNLACGAAAGVLSMIKRQASFDKPVPHLPKTEGELNENALRQLLLGLWGEKADRYAEKMLALTWEAIRQP